MAEVVPEEEEDYEVEYEEETYDDFALRGLRFFTNNLEGEEHEHEDILEEQEDMEEPIEEEPVQIVKPSVAFIAEKLAAQGVTMEQLIKAMLKDHDEYEEEEEECLRTDDELFGKFRIIISNYQPPQEVV
jgi:hypothetical protein